VAACRKL